MTTESIMWSCFIIYHLENLVVVCIYFPCSCQKSSSTGMYCSFWYWLVVAERCSLTCDVVKDMLLLLLLLWLMMQVAISVSSSLFAKSVKFKCWFGLIEPWNNQYYLLDFTDSTVLHISSKSGGLKWMEMLSSRFLLGDTAYSTEYI